jgi:hypothetical protein
MNAIEELTHPILGWAKGSKQMSAWLAESGFAKQRAALEAAPQTVDMEGQREAMAEFEG